MYPWVYLVQCLAYKYRVFYTLSTNKIWKKIVLWLETAIMENN